jgi:hypothetical protein
MSLMHHVEIVLRDAAKKKTRVNLSHSFFTSWDSLSVPRGMGGDRFRITASLQSQIHTWEPGGKQCTR